MKLLPQNALATLPRTYILPGETLAAKVDGRLEGVTGVEIQPATVYGFATDSYQAPINAREG